MNTLREDSIIEIAKQFLGKGLTEQQLFAIGEEAYEHVIANFNCRKEARKFPDANRILEQSIKAAVISAMDLALCEKHFWAYENSDDIPVVIDLENDIKTRINDSYIMQNRLRTLRKEQGLKLKDVCNEIEMWQPRLSNIERVLRPRTLVKSVAQIGNFYDVSMDYALGFDKIRGCAGGTRPDMDFCVDVLQEMSKKYNLSIRQLCEKMNIPRVSFLHYKLDKHGTSIGNLVRLSQLSGVPCAEMLK